MSMDGKHGVGRPAEVLGVYEEMGCGIVGLQESRRRDQCTIFQAGYVGYCSGESGGDGRGKKGKGGILLDARKSISRAERGSPEFICDSQLEVTLECLCCLASACDVRS